MASKTPKFAGLTLVLYLVLHSIPALAADPCDPDWFWSPVALPAAGNVMRYLKNDLKPRRSPSPLCDHYPYTLDDDLWDPPYAGERGYSYGHLIEPQNEGTPGALTILDLLVNPELDHAIQDDSQTRAAVMADPRLSTAFVCNPNYRKIIDQGPSLRFLLSESSGTGFTVGEHSVRVINGYEDQKRHYNLPAIAWPPGFRKEQTDRFMKSLLAFHDIGKSIAVRTGDKSRQADFNGPYVMTLMRTLGFNETEIKVAHALEQNDDTFGASLRGNISVEKAQADTERWAAFAGMPAKDFFKLQELYFTSDAGSYPDLRDRVFHKGPTGKILPRDFRYKVLSYPYRDTSVSAFAGGPQAENAYGYGPTMYRGESSTPGGNTTEMLGSTGSLPSVPGTDAATTGGNLQYDPELKAILNAGPSMRFMMGLPMHPAGNTEIPPTIGQSVTYRVNKYSNFVSGMGDRPILIKPNPRSKPMNSASIVGLAEAAKLMEQSLYDWVGNGGLKAPITRRNLLSRIAAAQGLPEGTVQVAEAITNTTAMGEIFAKKEKGKKGQSRPNIQKIRRDIQSDARQAGFTSKEAQADYFRAISAYYFSTQPDGMMGSFTESYVELQDFFVPHEQIRDSYLPGESF